MLGPAQIWVEHGKTFVTGLLAEVDTVKFPEGQENDSCLYSNLKSPCVMNKLQSVLSLACPGFTQMFALLLEMAGLSLQKGGG